MNKFNIYQSVILVFILTGAPLIAKSAIVTKTFVGTIINGSLTGAQGTGSFSYEEDFITNGDEALDSNSGLTIMFSFDNQDFDETNDIDFDTFPVLTFFNFEPDSLDYFLFSENNDVDFENPDLVSLSMFSLFPSAGSFDFETDIDAAYVVPIPGAFWLLGSGLAGLVAFRKKNNRSIISDHFQ
ncbi:MAG: VPLPA-CTERM sorting domain-containing protein [Methylococcales bacterium]